MLPEPIASLPGWLLAGVALGVVLALGAAAVFAVGVRLFPNSGEAGRGPEGGERRRRAEIRRYLADIGEPYREDVAVAGRPAAFYLPDRGVAITFDARDYFRFERAGVEAVLLEYELPGGHLGSRLPFETPEPAADESEPGHDERAWAGSRRAEWRRRVRTAADDGASAESAFETLGLPADATVEAVRAAYRDRVKDVHPDHGGDRESFRELREAYTVAKERAGSG